MKKLVIGVLVLICAPAVLAVPLSQADYNIQVKQLYDVLEAQQQDLNSALDNKEHRSALVAKACKYSTGLKQLKKLSGDNLGLQEAKQDFDLAKDLDIKFESSLLELGTSYNASCQKQSKKS